MAKINFHFNASGIKKRKACEDISLKRPGYHLQNLSKNHREKLVRLRTRRQQYSNSKTKLAMLFRKKQKRQNA